MNARKLGILGSAAVLALGAALWSTTTRQPVREEAVSEALVPGLEQGLNDIREIRVRGAGDAVLATLVRGEKGWTLTEKGGHAVDVTRVREYLVKLAQARRVEAKTSNPDLYDRLGVEPMSQADAYGAQIEIDGLAAPVKLIIGRNVQRGSGTYVRFADEAGSWQANADLALERVPANWLQKEIVDIAAGRVVRAVVTPPTGPAVEIERRPQEGGGDFVISNLPRGRAPASAYVADALGGLLGGLRFDDVFTSADRPVPGEGVTRSVLQTSDGIEVKIDSWVSDGRTHARFAAALDESRAGEAARAAQQRARAEHEASQAAQAVQAPEAGADAAGEASASTAAPAADAASTTAGDAPLAVTDPETDVAQRIEALRAEVAGINARTGAWVYVLPPYKAEHLNKPLESYLATKE